MMRKNANPVCDTEMNVSSLLVEAAETPNLAKLIVYK